MNLWEGQQNITKANFPARTLKLIIENSMINLYKVAEKVILVNPFSTPYKTLFNRVPYHTMTLKTIARTRVSLGE